MNDCVLEVCSPLFTLIYMHVKNRAFVRSATKARFENFVI